MSEPEVWLRGALPDYALELQPVAHALLQAREDLERLLPRVADEALYATPGGAASIAFHVMHLAGSIDRLLTYARGEQLSDTQLLTLKAERANEPRRNAAELLELARSRIDDALQALRATPVNSLNDAREVGRKRLPSTVRGLLFHAAEHTTRHVGQVSTMLKVLSAS